MWARKNPKNKSKPVFRKLRKALLIAILMEP
jgi:hypothetical protein